MNDFEDKIRSILISFAVNNCTAEAAKTAIEDIMQLMKHKGNVIHAKALRKKGTDEWYYFNLADGEFYKSRYPDLFCGIGDIQLPEDAELINVKIIVE